MKNQQELEFDQVRQKVLQWADQVDFAKHNPVIRRSVRRVVRPILCMLGGSVVAATLLGLMLRLM